MRCKFPSGIRAKTKTRNNPRECTGQKELSNQIKIPEPYIHLNISNHLKNLHKTTPLHSQRIDFSNDLDISFLPLRIYFQYGKTTPFSLPFKINSTVTIAKKMLAPRFHVSPESIKLYLFNSELSDTQLLRELRIPMNKRIQIAIEKPINKISLLFLMQHEAYRFEFPEETTVEQIKDELMRHADKKTISIKLLYNGLYLEDKYVLKDLNINQKNCIIVESEMLKKEDFVLDEKYDEFFENKTHEWSARTEIIARRRKAKSLLDNSGSPSNQKVLVCQPKTAPNTPRIRKFAKQKKKISSSIKNSQNEEEENEMEHKNILYLNEQFGNNSTSVSDSENEKIEAIIHQKNYQYFEKESENRNKEKIEIYFDSVTEQIKDLLSNNEVTFSILNHFTQKFFSDVFIELQDTKISEFQDKLFNYSHKKIHLQNEEECIAGICSLSFYLSITEINEKILQLPNILMKLLQNNQINFIIASGISYIFKQIAIMTNQKHSFDIEQFLYQINLSLEGNSTDFPIISALFMYFQSVKLNFYFFQKFSYYILMIIKQAIVIPNKQVQKTAVKLNEKRLEFDSSAYNSATNLINDIKYILQLKLSDDQAYGVFFLLSSLLKNNRDACEDQFEDIILALEGFFKIHSSENYLYFLSDLCECLKDQIQTKENEFFSIVFSNGIAFLNKIENCQNVSKMMKFLPSKFCPYINDACFKLFQSSPDCYFCLIKSVIQIMPSIVDCQFVIESFKELQLSLHFIDTAILFIHTYKSYISNLIEIIILKIDGQKTQSLKFLSEISFLSEFPLINYWNMAFESLNKPEDFRIESVPAINCIISKLSHQEQKSKMFSLLLNIYDDSSKVKIAFLNSVNDCLLNLFESSDLFRFLQEFFHDEDFEVSKSTLLLITKIRKISSSITQDFFNKEINQYQRIFNQLPCKKEQETFLKLLPLLIQACGDYIFAHTKYLTNFLMNILNSEALNFSNLQNRIKNIFNIKNDIKIRIHALKSFRSLIKIDHFYSECVPKSIDSIINQTFIYQNRNLHISAIKTLRIFFRLFKIQDFVPMSSLIRIHQQIFEFAKSSFDSKVNYQVFRLLGSIGPLIFPEFHTLKNLSNEGNDLYPLYEHSKREKSFLKFVMKYILNELQIKRRTHDLTSLSNAILYIFQNDNKCLIFLDQIIDVYSSMFDYEELTKCNSTFNISEYFHFFKIIVSVADIKILPHAETIYKLILPFLNEKVTLESVEILNSLIYALKSSFMPYKDDTFRIISAILNDFNITEEIEDSLLLSLTLIVVYVEGSLMVYFDSLKTILTRRKIIIFNDKNIILHSQKQNKQFNQSLYPLLFLCQVLYNCQSKIILIPSFRIALQLFEMDGKIKEISFCLIKIMLIKYANIVKDLLFNKKALELVNQVKSNSHILKPIRSLINSITDKTRNDINESFNVKVEDLFLRELEPKPYIKQSPLSPSYSDTAAKFSISSRMKNFVDVNNDWEEWLLQFSQDLILCSNSPAIRASLPLLNQSPTLVAEIFPYIIVSVWDCATLDERSELSKYLLNIVNNQRISKKILSSIASACDAMDRANFSLFDPSECGNISERCDSLFLALRFYEKSLSSNTEFTLNLLQINALLKQKEAALGLLQIAVPKDYNPILFETLSMWSQARDIYKSKYEQNPKNESYFTGFLKCSMHLEDWESVNKYIEEFDSYSQDLKQKTAMIFATAAQNTRCNPTKFLKFIKIDDPMSCMIHAINFINLYKLDEASSWIKRGITLTSLNKSYFSSGSYGPAIPNICIASNFEELNDIIDQRKGEKTVDQLLQIWKSKSSDYIKRDATQLCYTCHLKELLQWESAQLLTFRIDFVNTLRKLKEWSLFDVNFQRLIQNCPDERVSLMKAKSRFDRGITDDLSEFESIIKRMINENKKNDVYCDAICAYSSRCPISSEVVPRIKEVIQMQPTRSRSWKHWANFNFGCIKIFNDEEHKIKFASNAIQGYSNLVKMTGASLHYLYQFISLFFSFGTKLHNFKESADNLSSLTSSNVIEIIPQLMVHFSHPNKEIRDTVYAILKNFAGKHFQALALTLCFLSKMNIHSTQSFHDFIFEMMNDHRKIMEEAKNFADSMVNIAITDVEKVLQLLDIVINYQHPNNHLRKINSLFKRIKSILNEVHHGYVAEVLTKSVIQSITNRLNENQNSNVTLGEHYQFCAARAMSILNQQPKLYDVIDINEMEIQNFPTKPSSLVVPGFYSVNEKSVTIEKICNILKTIPSQKRPRKLRIIGSNGRKYKYLLKGREDLRLDQRVMQLFSLINCILHEDKFSTERNLQITRFPIIPLATNAGLIAWAKGGETLFSLINWHRQIVHMNKNDELNENETKDVLNIEKNYIYFLFENKSDYSLKLTSIHKLELFRKLCSFSSDDDLREALWLRSKNAEIWFSQVTNFSRTNGLMSIIGYVVGIGDRHPSNILVKKDTGNVVHIDFNDVFEKANLRSFAPETVPFRLTRMIVRALGPSGVHGVFEITAQKVMLLMRKNRETILAFLDIFVQDPITDTLWYSNFDNNMISDDNSNLNLNLNSVSESILNCIDSENSDILNSSFNGSLKVSIIEKAIDRIDEKLNGSEFEGEKLSHIEQVNRLIEMATNEMNLARMFHGWAPYW